MQPIRWVFVAGWAAWASVAWAANATSPVDYTQRNTPFAPAEGVATDKRTPEKNDAVQQKRVSPPTVDKQPAAVGDRRAAIEVNEARAKNVHEKETRPVEKVDVERSRYDRQRARISTQDDTNKPPTVAKYQDSLTAATQSNMARFPALDQATNVKVNRFVFRKNGGELAESAARASVVPAAGGSTLGR
jgi:hypothetical protein